ncbi:hypothetical protein B0H10DRAFT_1955354 [Mycena sp. CBHHK59/15]|nr:hypothetical protein B0H10DRAFT_1955354 [Mycena sp. CBHHK59/15]
MAQQRHSMDIFVCYGSPAYLDHIHDSMVIGLNPTIVRVSNNRPNLIYATHILVGSRTNLHNLDLIIPEEFHPPMRIPQVVIFHGNKVETAAISQHLNSQLPEAFRNLGICRHYHSDMSHDYLEDAYSSFVDPDGMVLILTRPQGLDVAGINGVIIYGISTDIPTKSQWDGQLGAAPKRTFCIHMIEPWVSNIDKSQLEVDRNDPDCPLSDVALIKKNLTKKECTGHHWFIMRHHQNDKSPEALDYMGHWCCDSSTHLSNTFALQHLFLGCVYKEELVSTPAKRKRVKYRPTKEHPDLEELLCQWRTETHGKFYLHAIRPPTFILDSLAVKALTMAPAFSITCTDNVTTLLQQSPEWAYLWAEGVYNIVSKYKPQAVAEGDEESDDDDEPQLKRKKS